MHRSSSGDHRATHRAELQHRRRHPPGPRRHGRGVTPRLPFLRRILKHPRLKQYKWLVVLAMAVNLGWAVYGAAAGDWWTSDGADLRAIALVAQTDLAAAVVFRQQYVLNALAWLVTRRRCPGRCGCGGCLASTLWPALARRHTPTSSSSAARLHALSGQVYPTTGAATRIGRLFADYDLLLADNDRIRICQHEFVSKSTPKLRQRTRLITPSASAGGVRAAIRQTRLTSGETILRCLMLEMMAAHRQPPISGAGHAVRNWARQPSSVVSAAGRPGRRPGRRSTSR